MIKDLYAWVGEDETGDDGLKSLVTPLGIAPAAFARRHVAENDEWVTQMEGVASVVGKPMRLVRFRVAEVIRVIHPQVKGQG